MANVWVISCLGDWLIFDHFQSYRWKAVSKLWGMKEKCMRNGVMNEQWNALNDQLSVFLILVKMYKKQNCAVSTDRLLSGNVVSRCDLSRTGKTSLWLSSIWRLPTCSPLGITWVLACGHGIWSATAPDLVPIDVHSVISFRWNCMKWPL